MSEPAPEAQPQQRASGSVFTRKMGPLPLWGWMGVGLGLALAYYFWKQHQASTAAAASAAQSQPASGTDQSLIPQFVNQVYTQGGPPEQPVTPVSGPPGPPGQTGPPGSPGPTGPPGVTSQASRYPAPTGLKAVKLTNTSGKINWNYITSVTPKPASYTVAVYQLNGKLAQQFTVNAPDTASGQAQATVSGLHPGWSYNVNVWANGGKLAPPHATAKLTVLWLAHIKT